MDWENRMVVLFKNREKYLTCLKFPGQIPMDNNKAERGLRHLVIKRKISYGSKTEKGAETIIWLASSPEVEGISGKYFKDKKETAGF